MVRKIWIFSVALTGVLAFLSSAIFIGAAFGGTMTLSAIKPRNCAARLSLKTSQPIPNTAGVGPINFSSSDIDYDTSNMFWTGTISGTVYTGLKIPVDGVYLVTASWRCGGFPKYSSLTDQPWMRVTVARNSPTVFFLDTGVYIYSLASDETGYVGQSMTYQFAKDDKLIMGVEVRSGLDRNTLTTGTLGLDLADPPVLTVIQLQ